MSSLAQPGDRFSVPLSSVAEHCLTVDLRRLGDLRRRLDVAVMTGPVEGSPAAVDLSDRLRAYAHDLAATALHAAIDHLGAWKRLFGTRVVPLYAHMSLLRTAHESALLAYWLTEPGIGADARRVRGMAAQFADYNERRKFEGSMGIKSANSGKLAVNRLAELIAEAAELGLIKINKEGVEVLKTGVPSTIELFDLYVRVEAPAKGGSVYRLQSGYAHAKQWVMLVGAQQAAPMDAFGRAIARMETPDTVVVGMTQMCVDALDSAVDAYEQLRR